MKEILWRKRTSKELLEDPVRNWELTCKEHGRNMEGTYKSYSEGPRRNIHERNGIGKFKESPQILEGFFK